MENERSRHKPRGEHETFLEAMQVTLVSRQIAAIFAKARGQSLGLRQAQIMKFLVLCLAHLSFVSQLFLMDLLQRSRIRKVPQKLRDLFAHPTEDRVQGGLVR